MCQSPTDRFDLQRFVIAQQPIYTSVLDELKSGRKKTHWMWFIFPQVAGLGHSSMAQRYAIRSTDEAMAYLKHPILERRLAECTLAVLDVTGRSAFDVFGSPDDAKFKSSLTLFSILTDDGIYARALKTFYDQADQATIDIVATWQAPS